MIGRRLPGGVREDNKNLMKKARSPLWGLPLFLVMIAWPCVATAGSWVRGYGETVTEATENALKAANAAVASRGKGCIGRNKGGPDTRLAAKEQGLFVVEVFYSHHAGSCGQLSNDEAWVRKQVEALTK